VSRSLKVVAVVALLLALAAFVIGFAGVILSGAIAAPSALASGPAVLFLGGLAAVYVVCLAVAAVQHFAKPGVVAVLNSRDAETRAPRAAPAALPRPRRTELRSL
jgi:hypothetical protein